MEAESIIRQDAVSRIMKDERTGEVHCRIDSVCLPSNLPVEDTSSIDRLRPTLGDKESTYFVGIYDGHA